MEKGLFFRKIDFCQEQLMCHQRGGRTDKSLKQKVMAHVQNDVSQYVHKVVAKMNSVVFSNVAKMNNRFSP
jgi:hypothetical protein